MVWGIIPCSPNMVAVRVCSKLKTSWKSVVFINKVRNNSRYFVSVFNKTIIPLALAWICDDYSQLRATRLVGHPPSHIQRTLEGQLLKRRTLFFRWVIVQFLHWYYTVTKIVSQVWVNSPNHYFLFLQRNRIMCCWFFSLLVKGEKLITLP